MRKVHVFAMFTTMRHGDSIGELFTSEEARSRSLRAFVEEFADEEDDLTDETSDGEMAEIASDHGHEVHFFDEEINAEVSRG